MGDYALYKALQSYTPQPNDPDSLGFQKADVLEISIQSPFGDTDNPRPGWLYAYNRRTGQEGYVPGKYSFCLSLLSVKYDVCCICS